MATWQWLLGGVVSAPFLAVAAVWIRVLLRGRSLLTPKARVLVIARIVELLGFVLLFAVVLVEPSVWVFVSFAALFGGTTLFRRRLRRRDEGLRPIAHPRV